MEYANPIIKGFNPDPSVCRAGDNYYLAVSTFEYFPGIAIYHSTDLVNWKLINHCISDYNSINFQGFGNSGGVWAPTIRYNNGRFYVTATIDKIGNIITYTDDILGSWSEPVHVDMGGIDPSIYFENGHAYYCTNENSGHGEAITLCEINPDTGELIGAKKEIWHGIGEGWLEAPHIYKINGWYYIFTAEGGTSYNHQLTIGRSKNLFGDYEAFPFNPILTNRNDTSKAIMCTGHADLTDDKDGNLYIVHLGTRPCSNAKSNLGRETFLTPISYSDGWFFVDKKRAALHNEAAICKKQIPYNGFSTRFDGKKFEPEWLFLNYTNITRDNELSITPHNSALTLAAIRQPDFEFEAETVFEFEPESSADEAGLIVYLQSDFNYRLCKIKKADGNYISVQKYADDFFQTAYEEKISDGKITASVKADKDFYYFYFAPYGEQPREVCCASTHPLCVEVPVRCFTGTVIGLYAVGSSKADFHSFRIK